MFGRAAITLGIGPHPSMLIIYDHVMKALHWLPVKQRIVHQLCLLKHLIHVGQAPQYLTVCVSSTISRYSLRSTDTAD